MYDTDSHREMDMATFKYDAYLAGFNRTFNSLDEVRAWATGLVAQYVLKGEVLKIHKSVKVFETENGCGFAAVFSRKPSHYCELVIGA